MYNKFMIWIKILGGDSNHFPLVMVLHKRTTISPSLFSLIMDEMKRHIQSELCHDVCYLHMIHFDKREKRQN